MADDLGPVTQTFEADVTEYMAAVDEAVATAQEFATANEEAKVAVDGLRDSAAEAGAAVGDIGAAAAEAGDGEGHLRDAALEAGEALGHVRDEALEASESVGRLGTQAEETAAKLDLMSLSGAGSFTALGPLVGLIGAAVVAGAAAAPAFAAMSLGIGAFGALAGPTLAAVSTGYQTISKDQQAVDAATTAAAKNTALTKLAHDWSLIPGPIAQAVKEVLSFKAEFTKLGQTSGIQSSVLGDLTKGLQVVEQLLPKIVPLAQAGAQAVSGIISALGAAVQSSPFMIFLRTMTQLVVPATQAVTRLATTIAGVLGGALEQLAPMSVPFINLVTQVVSALGGPAAAALHVAISLFLGLAQAIEPLLPGLSQIATVLINDIGSGFQSFIPIITQVVSILGGSLLKILQDLEPVIANALTPNSPFILALGQLPVILNAVMPLITGLASVLANPAIAQAAVWILSLVTAFKGLQGALALTQSGFTFIAAVPGRIAALGASIASFVTTVVSQLAAATAATVAWIAEHAVATAAFIAQNVAQAASATAAFIAENLATLGIVALIALLVAAIIYLATHWQQVWGDIKNWALDAWHFLDNEVIHPIQNGIAAMVNWIKSHWQLLATILATVLLGPVGGLVVFLATHWRQVTADVSRLVGDVTSFFRQLPGRIMSAIASLPGLLLQAGRNIITSLISGAASMVSGALGTLAGWGHDLANALMSPFGLHFSEPSDALQMIKAGHNTIMSYVQGIRAAAPAAHAALNAALGGSPLLQGTGAAGAIAPAGGGTSVHVTVPVTAQGMTPDYNDPRFLQYMQAAVQEAALRYGQVNPGNGFTSAWGR